MKSRACILVLLTFALILAGCRAGELSSVAEAAEKAPRELNLTAEAADQALVDNKSPASGGTYCPVTRPPNPAFIPPDPYPPLPPSEDEFWLGENGLWTALPEDGSWGQLAMGEKFWWWSEDFDVKEDSTPDLVVTARRLDGNAPEFHVSEATNGYHPSFHWAMLIGVKLASPGCWEFTGEYNDQQLSFVLWVPGE